MCGCHRLCTSYVTIVLKSRQNRVTDIAAHGKSAHNILTTERRQVQISGELVWCECNC